MEIIGIEYVKYTSKKTGKLVDGVNVYWRQLLPITDKSGNELNNQGYACGHEYVKRDIFDKAGLSVGDSFQCLYNKYGSIEDIKLVI